MLKLSSLLLLALSLQITSACTLSADAGGKEVAKADIGGGGNSQDYKYNFTCNGCATGEQHFTDKGAYCGALLDEGRNNSCCRRLREDEYKTNCN